MEVNHDLDTGIGFDMRNTHIYHDSDDDEDDELIDAHHRPRPYGFKEDDESACGCCYVLLIVVIVLVGSGIGYALGSSFSKPQPFEPQTDPPHGTTARNPYLRNTPSPVQTDPFHRQSGGGSISSLFAPQTSTSKPATDHDTPPHKLDQVAFEPSAAKAKTPLQPSAAQQKETAFEPTAAKTETAFEPTAATGKQEETAFEPTAAAQTPPPPAPQTSKDAVDKTSKDVRYSGTLDMQAVNAVLHSAKYDVAFTDEQLSTPAAYASDIGEHAVLLSKVVLDGYEVPSIFEHAHRFNVKYPSTKDRTYAMNAYRTWCFHFHLFAFDAAQIDVVFNEFQIERGFDRVLVRRFNQSFVDPPVVYAGRGSFDASKQAWILPETLSYHVRRSEFQSVCVEFESDDSVALPAGGVDFDVVVRYDECAWSDYSECFVADDHLKHWDRGPWYDGLCGIGVHHRERSPKKSAHSAKADAAAAFVDCAPGVNGAEIDGPDYCLKAPCERIDNAHNANMPEKVRYGWAETASFWNGVGTLDATHPDLARILTAHPSTPATFTSAAEVKKYFQFPAFNELYQSYPVYRVNPTRHLFDLDAIIAALLDKRTSILAEHVDERVLTLPVLKLAHTNRTMQWLGARLAHSLLIGRTFTMMFTGSSNTAGHDNQFASTYPMQLQARLRTFWTSIGVDGAAFSARNIAVGGAPKTETMAWHIAARSSETVAYPFNDLGVTQSSAFWRNEDVIVWESFMNDGGRPPEIATEQQLRLTALLNAIFVAQDSIGSLDKDHCNADTTLDGLRPPRHVNSNRVFETLSAVYGESMGFIEMDFGTFVRAVCSEPKYATMKINWHPNSKGHRCEADIYAYMLLSAVSQFLRANRDQIASLSSEQQGTSRLDDWLLQQSGAWSLPYMQSVQQQNFKLFPAPKYCHPFCDRTIAPFTLRTSEPCDWDVGSRMSDYVLFEYAQMDANLTDVYARHVDGVNDEKIPDRTSNFSTEKLLHAIGGWSYVDPDRDVVHYPQDRTGKIGAMDRKREFSADMIWWFAAYKTFLQETMHAAADAALVEETMQTRKFRGGGQVPPNQVDAINAICAKYVEQWSQYVLKQKLDLRVAFLVPQIGSHSILAFTGEGGRAFYGIDDDKEPHVMGMHIQPLNKDDRAINTKNKQYKLDFNKMVSAQRKCQTYQRGCVFEQIPPGKYMMRWYPMNLTAGVQPLVQIVAF